MVKKKIKIAVASDTHGCHRRINIPECDIFVYCGDAGITSYKKLEDFNDWLENLPVKHVIFIAGNHDIYLEEIGKENAKMLLSNAIYLENEGVQIEGIKFWGSPYSLEFNGWSFMKDENGLKQIWDLIPKKTDFLITHGPAFGNLDRVGWKNQGSQSLRYKIDEIKPKYHLSGHIHEEYRVIKTSHITHINASILNERYELINEPIEFYYEK